MLALRSNLNMFSNIVCTQNQQKQQNHGFTLAMATGELKQIDKEFVLWTFAFRIYSIQIQTQYDWVLAAGCWLTLTHQQPIDQWPERIHWLINRKILFIVIVFVSRSPCIAHRNRCLLTTDSNGVWRVTFLSLSYRTTTNSKKRGKNKIPYLIVWRRRP